MVVLGTGIPILSAGPWNGAVEYERGMGFLKEMVETSLINIFGLKWLDTWPT
jgi:hypothetical protein